MIRPDDIEVDIESIAAVIASQPPPLHPVVEARLRKVAEAVLEVFRLNPVVEEMDDA